MAAVRAEHPSAYTESGSEFYAIEEPTNYVPPESDLASLSSRLNTDVLWLGFQSAVDAFQFHHWRSGAHFRALVFGCFDEKRTWERVEGEPEEWERLAFFNEVRLRDALEYVDSAEARNLQRIWRNAEIVPGRTEPSINGRESARRVAEFYRLPGWALEETEQPPIRNLAMSFNRRAGNDNGLPA
jgi:hypothetical protein